MTSKSPLLGGGRTTKMSRKFSFRLTHHRHSNGDDKVDEEDALHPTRRLFKTFSSFATDRSRENNKAVLSDEEERFPSLDEGAAEREERQATEPPRREAPKKGRPKIQPRRLFHDKKNVSKPKTLAGMDGIPGVIAFAASANSSNPSWSLAGEEAAPEDDTSELSFEGGPLQDERTLTPHPSYEDGSEHYPVAAKDFHYLYEAAGTTLVLDVQEWPSDEEEDKEGPSAKRSNQRRLKAKSRRKKKLFGRIRAD